MHMQQFATFWSMFYNWYHLQMNLHSIWWCEGQINPPVFPTSHLGYALCNSVVQPPCGNVKNGFRSKTLPHILPKDMLASLLVVPSVLMLVFVSVLHAFSVVNLLVFEQKSLLLLLICGNKTRICAHNFFLIPSPEQDHMELRNYFQISFTECYSLFSVSICSAYLSIVICENCGSDISIALL